MGQKAFYFDMKKCAGCHACEVACRDRNALYNVGELFRKVDLYEIKSSVSFHESFADNVSRLASIMGNVDRKTVVYSGQSASAHGVEFVNYANVSNLPARQKIHEEICANPR